VLTLKDSADCFTTVLYGEASRNKLNVDKIRPVFAPVNVPTAEDSVMFVSRFK
jgi:hypothetical protein